MSTADVEKELIKSNSNDVTSFLSNLNSTIDSRASSNEVQESVVNRFYYSVGSVKFLIEQNLKVENISPSTINKVPHLQTWYEGIISVRGTIMPVIHLHKFLNEQIDFKEVNNNYENNNDVHFLMLDHADHTPIVLLIDELPATVNIKKYKKKNAPNNSPDWFEHTLENNNDKMINVNHSKLLKQLANLQ